MKIILFGGSGLVGKEFRKQFAEHEIVAPTHEEVDVTKMETVKPELFAGADLIVNATGYNAVDAAETDREACWNLNVVAVGNLAAVARATSTPIVHISSLYVFDGVDAEHPKPVSYYAMSKLMAEMILKYMDPDYYLFRTVRLFGDTGSGKRTFIDIVRDAPPDAKFIVDEYAQPTYVVDFVKRMKAVIEGRFTKRPFNVVNAGTCSWLDFAKEVARLTEKEEKFEAVSKNEFPRAAQRPSSLVFETNLRPWKEALAEYLCPPSR